MGPVAYEDGNMIELDEDELEEYAELWGVSVDEVEDLLEQISPDFDTMTLVEVRDYIDSMYEALEAAGWDGLDLSDFWDMYYGYEPGSR